MQKTLALNRLSVGRTGESLITDQTEILYLVHLIGKSIGMIYQTEEAEFFDIRSNSDIPIQAAYSWFDDVGFIEWDTLNDY
ncbi:hypothetical protein Ct9H90mP29_15370 [bacterium]|nr:MAG: hypothetical protein Ct9H90mP29_15370 [bacterium]